MDIVANDYQVNDGQDGDDKLEFGNEQEFDDEQTEVTEMITKLIQGSFKDQHTLKGKRKQIRSPPLRAGNSL